jgi:hypothetical protein
MSNENHRGKDPTRPARIRHAQEARAGAQLTVDRLRVQLDELQEKTVDKTIELVAAEEALEALVAEERRMLRERPGLATIALVKGAA